MRQALGAGFLNIGAIDSVPVRLVKCVHEIAVIQFWKIITLVVSTSMNIKRFKN